MSNSTRLVRASCRFSSPLRRRCHSIQTQRYDTALLRFSGPPVRHMGIFKDFSDHLKGEVKKNPELQKSLDQFKQKAYDFKGRSKEAIDQLNKHYKGVEASALQVSSVVKGKINVAKEKLSEASAQVKESVSSFKVGASEPSKGTSSAEEGGLGASRGQQHPSGSANRPSKGFQMLLTSMASFFDKFKGAKVVGLTKNLYDVFMEELTTTSSRRRIKAPYADTSTVERSTSTALIPVVRKHSAWEKRWESWKDKIRAHHLYKRVRGIKELPIVTKSQELAEDVRERWEMSDSPVVHKIQNLNDAVFGETASAVAVKEIRQRDPMFSFPDFLVEVQESTRPVLQAYLKGDLKGLQKRCSREVVDRCRAERRGYESQGIFMDNKLLHISDVEVKETKLLGNTPIIIVGFQTQQVYCVRDKYGKITQGAKDDIHTVFYAWAMQQVVPEEGATYPYWQLREMQQLGIQSII